MNQVQMQIIKYTWQVQYIFLWIQYKESTMKIKKICNIWGNPPQYILSKYTHVYFPFYFLPKLRQMGNGNGNREIVFEKYFWDTPNTLIKYKYEYPISSVIKCK